MGKVYEEITDELAQWMARQHLFFVASAPLAQNGFVNCSPKGMDSFRVVSPREVAYLDLTGSGIETVAHVRENGRIVFMFCAFSESPKIVRLHGNGTVHTSKSSRWESLHALFPIQPGVRAIVTAEINRISDSCGFAVPILEFKEDRDILKKSHSAKGELELQEYRRRKNSLSLDGLAGLDESV
jgi:hypothetical protein